MTVEAFPHGQAQEAVRDLGAKSGAGTVRASPDQDEALALLGLDSR